MEIQEEQGKCLSKRKQHYDEDDDFIEEAPKHKKLSLLKKGKALQPSNRFNTTISEEEVTVSSKGCIPANTARNTQWALRDFHLWVKQRNKRIKEQFPADLFDKLKKYVLACSDL